MTRTEDWGGLESAPRWIIMVTGAYLVLGLFALYVWYSAAQRLSMQTPSAGAEGLSVTGMAAAQAWLCLLVFRSFQRGAPLRRVWLLIMLSAIAHVAGGLIAQASETAWLLNPLVPLGSTEQLHRTGLILSGPVQMALLAAGLLAALRVLRRFGFGVRPKAIGWAVAGILILFALTRFGETAGKQFTADSAISLIRTLLLCVLSVEALFLWLSAVRMGRGLIAKCWRAFAIGIFVIGFGEAALWALGRYFPGWLVATLDWYVWFPAAAVFALAPAHCVAAVRRATGRVTRPSSDLPVRAFPRTVPAN
ncbi:MAG: hypothetical protein ABSH46_03130 [Bryobacteraceae bacterium]|jgi:hypothetical protein